jgi:2-oxo-3-hexenedioate decarboxylase
VTSIVDAAALARELASAYANRAILPGPLSSRESTFNLDAAYDIEAELVRLRRASGRTTVGRKVGYANKALWRALKIDTLVWAHMYDDTVTMAHGNRATLSLGRMCSPKLEPEIVFKLRTPVADGATDAGAILSSVEWMALGFEIVDSIYADWTFQPSDFVAAYGLHAALVVGEPLAVNADNLTTIVERLPTFRVRLYRNDALAAEGSGRNCLRSAALCLGELASAIARRGGQEPLLGGELVSSGTLTEPQPIEAGETWRASVEGLDLGDLALQTK